MDSERVKTTQTCIHKILPFAGVLTICTTTVVSGPVHGLTPPNLLYERGTNTPGFKFKVDYQTEFFQLPVDNQVLLGKWKGRRDAGIKFEVDFRSDGSYTYMVGQNGDWWLTHIGEYQLRPSRSLRLESLETVLMLTRRGYYVNQDLMSKMS